LLGGLRGYIGGGRTQWPKRWPKPLRVRSVKGGAGIREQRVEGNSVVALATVEELRVHIKRHPAFGVADLMVDGRFQDAFADVALVPALALTA
jgi:hypothetical protein